MVSEAEVDTLSRVRTECPTIHADGPIGLGFLPTIHCGDGGYVDYPRSGLAAGIPRIPRCRPSQVGLSPHDDDLPQPDFGPAWAGCRGSATVMLNFRMARDPERAPLRGQLSNFSRLSEG
jgi:hypothetical protein